MLKEMSNLAVAIYLQAMYNKGCNAMGLKDTEMNREAFLISITRVMTENLLMGTLDGSIDAAGIDELLDTQGSGLTAGRPAPSPSSPFGGKSSNPLDILKDLGIDIGSLDPSSPNPMTQTEAPESNQNQEVLKDDSDDVDLGNIPMFRSEDFVN